MSAGWPKSLDSAMRRILIEVLGQPDEQVHDVFSDRQHAAGTNASTAFEAGGCNRKNKVIINERPRRGLGCKAEN